MEISTEKPIKQRNLNKLEGDQYLEFLFLLDQKLKSLGEITDVDEGFETSSKIIVDCLVDLLRRKKLVIRIKKNPHGEQTRNKVKNETVKRDQLFKLWILQSNDCNRERFVKQRNRVTTVIRNAKEITMRKF